MEDRDGEGFFRGVWRSEKIWGHQRKQQEWELETADPTTDVPGPGIPLFGQLPGPVPEWEKDGTHHPPVSGGNF